MDVWHDWDVVWDVCLGCCIGLPAISVPSGKSSSQLPLGLQLIAGRFQEEVLLRVALAFEQFSK